MGTKWKAGISFWISGNSLLLWGWLNTGMCCPDKLWSLPFWRYSKGTWTQSWSTCCRWFCLSREAGLDDLQRCLSTSTTLWILGVWSWAPSHHWRQTNVSSGKAGPIKAAWICSGSEKSPITDCIRKLVAKLLFSGCNHTSHKSGSQNDVLTTQKEVSLKWLQGLHLGISFHLNHRQCDLRLLWIKATQSIQ